MYGCVYREGESAWAHFIIVSLKQTISRTRKFVTPAPVPFCTFFDLGKEQNVIGTHAMKHILIVKLELDYSTRKWRRKYGLKLKQVFNGSIWVVSATCLPLFRDKVMTPEGLHKNPPAWRGAVSAAHKYF